MLRNATFRLTVSYLAIMMALSILFSIVLYQTSSTELRTGLHRQLPYYQQTESPVTGPDLQGFQDLESLASEHRLQLELVLVNLVLLVAGGGVSFWLARRNLMPIEAAFEAQSRFTGDASHELRTPLTAMKTEIEVALRNKALPASEAREVLKSSLEEVAKLEALSNGLLRLAHHDHGEPSDFEAVSLAQVAAGAIERLNGSIKQRPVTVINEVEPIMVMGDGEHLIELLTVLLDNAIKYSPPQADVTLATRLRGGMVYLEVRDKGAGIASADLPHIFDRFYRADVSRSKDKVNGYGLGLSIARKIAELHRGSIEVTSRRGHGSTFIVKLPLAAEQS